MNEIQDMDWSAMDVHATLYSTTQGLSRAS